MTDLFNPKHLLQQINADISACETLLALLEEERNALKDRNIDAMDALIEQKATQLSLLEASAQQRTNWARQHSNSADQESIKQTWLNLLDNTQIPIIKEQWEKLKQLQKQCKQANEVNGKILARNQKTFNRLLDIVRGQTATPNLYSAAGKNTSSHVSHKMGEA